jgi:K+-sensing histidine kinase KdpD
MSLGSHRAQGKETVERIYNLRTPLMVIKSVITMFDRYWDRLDLEKRRDLIQIAFDEIERLDAKIGRLADDRRIRLDDE